LTRVRLAQCYTRSSWFPWCPSAALKWKARSAALLRDIDSLAPDVLMLQEVDEYSTFWAPQMQQRGYTGVYKKRTELSGPKKDGCALFWLEERFALEASLEVEHNALADGLPERPPGAPLRADGDGDALDARTRLERDCVGLVAQLLSRATGTRLVVGTTHAYWDPALADVKLAQSGHMLRRIAEFRRECCARTGAASMPVLFGGDFNSLPDSDVYALLTSAAGAHGLPPLRSAHAAAGGGSEPPFTNRTPSFTGTLDYLLCTPDVALHRVLALPAAGELAEGLPDEAHPSDHLPLVACVSLS
jgi:CCR4-NOT transcription complex subunit 6